MEYPNTVLHSKMECVCVCDCIRYCTPSLACATGESSETLDVLPTVRAFGGQGDTSEEEESISEEVREAVREGGIIQEAPSPEQAVTVDGRGEVRLLAES